MNLFGYLMEEMNLGKLWTGEKITWTPFWFGCIAGIIPWACM